MKKASSLVKRGHVVVSLGTQDREKKTELIKFRVEPSFVYEVKRQADLSGFGDVSTFFRQLVKERSHVDEFKFNRAKEIVAEMKRFGIGLAMLRAAGLNE